MEDIINKENTHYVAPAEVDPVTQVISGRPHISWRAIFAGAFVAVLVEMLLTTLGVAVGGIGLERVVQQGGGTGLSIGAGIWFIASAIIALGCGGYASARVSGLVPSRVGGVEGLVVSALLFVALFAGIGSGLGALGKGTGALLGSAGRGVTDVAGNEQVQSVVQGALGDMNLRSDPTQVAQGVASRLLSGDEQGAVNYLAAQAGIQPTEARIRMQQMRADLTSAAKGVGQSMARGVQLAGWTMFLTILLGSAAGLLGGALGARRNFRQPMSDTDWRLASHARPQWLSRTGDHGVERPTELHSPS
jgi:hypothetical protein